MDNYDNYYDTNYEEVTDESPKMPQLYYTIGDVAKELGEETSTIRYWSNKYHDLLDVELCNTHRRYSKLDIDKLRVVKKCKEKNMSHNQIINTLKETNFDITIIEKRFEDMQKPFDIQLLASALAVEVENRLKELEDNLFARITEHMNNQAENVNNMADTIKEEVCTTVDEVINEKLEGIEDNIGDINKKLDEIKEFACVDMNKEKERENDKWWKKIFR